MKLIEIKNSLAKLYYEPADFPLRLSDFLTIDDSNQKIIAQVISIESTSRDTTNCAILKFSLDLNEDNSHTVYSGYAPPLDALVSRTKPEIISNIFSNPKETVCLGKLSGSIGGEINLKSSLLNDFLYIQADVESQKNKLTEKLLEFNLKQKRKTLYIDYDGILNYPQEAKVITLGKEFKLPVSSDILNYIYENDLKGLTLEQKTIVQDIILEIQDYIESLDTGFIPFNTLLSVVNDIYNTDKSVGIILFRNKLLKYNQSNIFASQEEEITSLEKSIENNAITILNIENIDTNWQKETIDFLIEYLQLGYYLIFEVKDDSIDKKSLNNIYKKENIKPVIISKYESDFAPLLKSFAKNLILFKPLTQQRAFATYNSFLNKLSNEEFIVSGDATFYTPLIIQELSEEIEITENTENANNIVESEDKILSQLEEKTDANLKDKDIEKEVIEEQELQNTKADDTVLNEETTNLDIDSLETIEDIEPLKEEEEEENELKNIFEESLEQEIAKDVDKMFYAEAAIKDETEAVTKEDFKEELNEDYSSQKFEEESKNQNEDIDLNITDKTEDNLYMYNDDNDLLSDEDLDLLDEIQNDDSDNNIEQEIDLVDNVPIMNDLSAISDEEDLSELSEDSIEGLDIPDENKLADLTQDDELMPLDTENNQEESILSDNFSEDNELSGVPIYQTELPDSSDNDSTVKIAEGNIVYHEKYGRGVVEQLINYGNKTLCSIQFDNVGRRLLDPNLADLKQM